ncbi:MAG: hypothetical protein NTX91_00025, partial [candidate division SR1 bacterium]|nr:hypothetical protein [candidate division SR1 bacterium]
MEELGISHEKIGPFGDSIEVIDPHGILAKVKAENAEGKYALFCANHIRSKKLLPEQDFFLTKKYLQKQGIGIIPVQLINHYNLGGIVGNVVNGISSVLQAPFNAGRIKVYADAGRKLPLDMKENYVKKNKKSFADPKIAENNIRISPYEDTYMYESGWQNFSYNGMNERIVEKSGRVREAKLAHTFAKENRFPGHDIIPLYIHEDERGKFYMSVGDAISKGEKKVHDIELEYLQSMQAL